MGNGIVGLEGGGGREAEPGSGRGLMCNFTTSMTFAFRWAAT